VEPVLGATQVLRIQLARSGQTLGAASANGRALVDNPQNLSPGVPTVVVPPPPVIRPVVEVSHRLIRVGANCSGVTACGSASGIVKPASGYCY
jgi:hypothetical protein